MKPELKKMLVEGSASLGVSLKEEQVLLLSAYLEKLIEENQKINLTAYKKEEEVILFLFLDSLAVLRLIKEKDAKLIDLGTGGGFPGVPLKIAEPTLDITLVDSVEKKVKFLEELRKILGIEGLKITKGRAEELGRESSLRENFDYAVSKALAPLNVLIEYAFPFLKVGGYLIAQKGRGLEKEVKEAESALEILGGNIEKIDSVILPGTSIERKNVLIRKLMPTPEKFPRKTGMAAKKPL